MTASGPIDQRTLLQGKGSTYTLEELVHHPHVATHCEHGSFLTYYPYSDTCRTCSSITKVYGDVKHHFPLSLVPEKP
jgi:hypothetical protein